MRIGDFKLTLATCLAASIPMNMLKLTYLRMETKRTAVGADIEQGISSVPLAAAPLYIAAEVVASGRQRGAERAEEPDVTQKYMRIPGSAVDFCRYV